MQPDRIDKIRALLDSPQEGEREAARAALARVVDRRPPKGSEAWNAAVREWSGKIEFCLSRLGSPTLTRDEQRTIRNFARYRGDPWSRSAEALIAVYDKLQQGDFGER